MNIPIHVRTTGKTTTNGRRRYVEVACDCGATNMILSYNLTKTKYCSANCPLLRRDTRIWRSTHGVSKHRLYGVWRGMMQRCHNPKDPGYFKYGGRGIIVCDRWKDVAVFIEDMDSTYVQGLQIDRINNDGNYEPTNCHWVTIRVNSLNKRNSLSRRFGIPHNHSEIAESLGLTKNVISERVRKGWAWDRAISTPIKHYRKHKSI